MFRQRDSGAYFVFEELEKLPGFVHAFTTRKNHPCVKDAGVSQEVAPERRLLLRTLGLKEDELVFLRQLHSSRVHILGEVPDNASLPQDLQAADGVILMEPGCFSVIRTADCLPILGVGEGRQVCSLHAGWRGTRDRITGKGFSQFLEITGLHPRQVKVAFGPCIRSCCYQVGAETRMQYATAGHPVERIFMGEFLDLAEASRLQLGELGIDRILDSGICTACRNDLFYSYRREATSSRMWAIAGFHT